MVVLLGVVIGLALGALGGGGSVLAVPALVHVMGQGPVTATTGSLIIVGIAAVLSLPAHHRAHRVRFRQGLTFGLLGTLGSVAGSSAARAVSASVLMTIFAAVMVVVAVLMLRREAKGEESPSAGPSPARGAGPSSGRAGRLVTLVAAATLVGLLTGFLGVGGGFLLVPALVLVLDLPMPVAVGTSLLVVAVNSATALADRAMHGLGHLDWPLLLGFAAAAVAGSALGSRLVDRVPAQRLSQAFAVVLLAVAAVTIAQFVPTLLA